MKNWKTMMNDKPAMYIFVNKGLGMSSGKLMSQAAHAAVEAFQISREDMVEMWMLGKHYTKIVFEARNADHLKTIQKYLEDRGFASELIIDEGHTEVDPHVATALGVEIVNRSSENVQATFSSFDIWRDTVRVTLEIPR